MPRPLSILVVDDDVNIAGLLGAALRREGFAAELLRDGRAALEAVARGEPPAAVILDIMLPYVDGFAVAEAMRRSPRWAGVPIVMLTARSQPADLERARALGVADYVVKPFQPLALLATIRKLASPGGP